MTRLTGPIDIEQQRTHMMMCSISTGFWPEQPHANGSRIIGNNPLSEYKGAQYGIGRSSHYEVNPVNGTGEARRITGDYLYRTQVSIMFDGRIWRIFRVTP